MNSFPSDVALDNTIKQKKNTESRANPKWIRISSIKLIRNRAELNFEL